METLAKCKTTNTTFGGGRPWWGDYKEENLWYLAKEEMNMGDQSRIKPPVL